MKILITGACGQLGYECLNEVVSRGHEVVGTDIRAPFDGISDRKAPYIPLDITDENAVTETMRRIRPDAILHCAAWTDVDAAEIGKNREKARAVNSGGTAVLARTAKSMDAKMLYLSTDYVFNGCGESAWKPDDREFGPLNVYGQTKLEGERELENALDRFFIVRTSWLFGLKGGNFISTMVTAGRKHGTVRVVNDQIGMPTYARDLARLLVDMVETDRYGRYHATNEKGYISRYDLCREIYRQCGLRTEIVPVSTLEYGPTPAKRPLNSRLDTGKLAEVGFAPLPDWKDAVARYLMEARLS